METVYAENSLPIGYNTIESVMKKVFPSVFEKFVTGDSRAREVFMYLGKDCTATLRIPAVRDAGYRKIDVRVHGRSYTKMGAYPDEVLHYVLKHHDVIGKVYPYADKPSVIESLTSK